MFEVLAFVYEHSAGADFGVRNGQLMRSLQGVGFASDEIEDALDWLQALDDAAEMASASRWLAPPRPQSQRIYPRHEQNHLGPQALGFLYFLESSGAMPPALREIIVDRAMAAPGAPLRLDDLKLIVLMVYQRFGEMPDALVMDELCSTDPLPRVMH